MDYGDLGERLAFAVVDSHGVQNAHIAALKNQVQARQQAHGPLQHNRKLVILLIRKTEFVVIRGSLHQQTDALYLALPYVPQAFHITPEAVNSIAQTAYTAYRVGKFQAAPVNLVL